jgi:hypothetical protein
VNSRRLSLLACSLSLAAGACAADQDPPAPGALSPAELRARVDALLPPILDRSADQIDAAESTVFTIAHTVGLENLATSTTRRWVPLDGAQAAAWLDRAALADELYDGRVFHLDPSALCSGDDACLTALASTDYTIVATALPDGGVHLSVHDLDEHEVASLELATGGAHFSADMKAFAPVMQGLVFPAAAQQGLRVNATGNIAGDLSMAEEGGFHIRIGGPFHVGIDSAKTPAKVTSLDVGDGSSIDSSREQGHGPVIVHTQLTNLAFHVADLADEAGLRIDADSSVTGGNAEITRLDLSAK